MANFGESKKIQEMLQNFSTVWVLEGHGRRTRIHMRNLKPKNTGNEKLAE